MKFIEKSARAAESLSLLMGTFCFDKLQNHTFMILTRHHYVI